METKVYSTLTDAAVHLNLDDAPEIAAE